MYDAKVIQENREMNSAKNPRGILVMKKENQCEDEDLLLQKPHKVEDEIKRTKSNPNRGVKIGVGGINTKSKS